MSGTPLWWWRVTALILVGLVVLLGSAGTAQRLESIAAADPLPGGPSDGALKSGLKPPLEGLAAMGAIGFIFRGSTPDNDATLGSIELASEAITGMVVNISWAQIEPQPGQLDTTTIDRILAGAAAYNSRHPAAPIRLKFRVYGGPQAPDWAKNLGGPPLNASRVLPGRAPVPIRIGRFWSEEYNQAWSGLQHRLAARYDANPLVSEVSDTACSSETGEPEIIPPDSTSQANLIAAGFTHQAFISCLQNSYMAYSGWRATRIDRAFGWTRWVRGNLGLDLMTAWRQRLGSQAVLTAHSLGKMGPNFASNLGRLYGQMQSLGPPIEFQLRAPLGSKFSVDDLDKAIQEGVSYGANAVELWQNQVVPDAPIEGYMGLLKKWSSTLRANAQKQ
jgi:hypothetical protein